MIPITPEIRQAIIDAGDEPIRLLDPETNTVYLLVPVVHHADNELDAEEEEDIQRMVEQLDPEDLDEPIRFGM